MLMNIGLFAFIGNALQAVAEFCLDYQHSCAEPLKCCGPTCCNPPIMTDNKISYGQFWVFCGVIGLFVVLGCAACGMCRHKVANFKPHAFQFANSIHCRWRRRWQVESNNDMEVLAEEEDTVPATTLVNPPSYDVAIGAPPTYAETVVGDETLPSYQQHDPLSPQQQEMQNSREHPPNYSGPSRDDHLSS